ncbi:MAG: lysophospholipid acyltransferase family protein [Mycobacteriaceae bacterium]
MRGLRGPREPVYSTLVGSARTLSRVQGLKVTRHGTQNVPRAGGVILAANHTGYLDFAQVGLTARTAGRSVRFLMKAELERNRVVAFLMRHCGAIGVDRTHGAAAYARAVAALRAGECVCIYPEATISRSFEIKELKSGAARMALEAQVPIVPVAIWGEQRLWSKGVPRALGRHHVPVHVVVGAPLGPEGSPDELTARLRTVMEDALAQAQAGYEHPPGAPWVPARLGGGAPTPEEAAVIEATVRARRGSGGEQAGPL